MLDCRIPGKLRLNLGFDGENMICEYFQSRSTVNPWQRDSARSNEMYRMVTTSMMV
jgi:hypothetical protein